MLEIKCGANDRDVWVFSIVSISLTYWSGILHVGPWFLQGCRPGRCKARPGPHRRGFKAPDRNAFPAIIKQLLQFEAGLIIDQWQRERTNREGNMLRRPSKLDSHFNRLTTRISQAPYSEREMVLTCFGHIQRKKKTEA